MRRGKLSLAIILLLVSAACIHKASGPITPMERVTTDNAVFAQLNNSIEQGSEAVAASSLLSAQQVAPVIAWTGQVAQIHQQLTAILQKGSTVSASDYTTVQALIAQVQASASVLVASGNFGVKNPKTQQTIAADITAVSNLAQALLTEIAAIKGGS